MASNYRHATAALPPGKTPGTHEVRSWVDFRTGMDVSKNRKNPDRPVRRVATTPITLSQLLLPLSYFHPHVIALKIYSNHNSMRWEHKCYFTILKIHENLFAL